MSIPVDSLWIAIDFGGTTTKVSFPAKDGKSIANLEFPTIFHYSQGDGKISVAESALKLAEDSPEGILFVEKKHLHPKKSYLLSDRKTSVMQSALITAFLVHIRTHCEKEYFDGQPITTCIFALRPPYRSRHSVLREAATASGFQNVMFRDDAVALATAWYYGNQMQSSEYVLLCDFGGDVVTLTLLRHKYGGFERIASRHSDGIRYGGNSTQRNILDPVFKQLHDSQAPSVLHSWLKKKNVFLLKIRESKEQYFEANKEFPQKVSVGKKTLKIDQKQLDHVAFKLAQHQVGILNSFWNNCKKEDKNINLNQISLVVAGKGALSPYIESFVREMKHKKTFFPDNKDCTAANGTVRLLNTDPLSRRAEDSQTKNFSIAYAEAIAGDRSAQYELGKCHAYGHGTPVSDEDSFFWFQLAAKQGHVKAVYRLGKCYMNGYGCISSMNTAMQFFQLAADQGNLKAQYRLGEIFSNKHSEFYNNEQALFWLKKAADAGYAKAVTKMEGIEKKQTAKSPTKQPVAPKKKWQHFPIVEKFIGSLLSCLILFLGGFTFNHAQELNRTAVIGGNLLIFFAVFVSLYAAILLVQYLHVTTSQDSKISE